MARKNERYAKCFAKLISRVSGTKAQANCKRNRFKFGIKVPESTTNAYQLDKSNGDSSWEDAIRNQLYEIDEYNVFKLLFKGASSLHECKRIKYFHD